MAGITIWNFYFRLFPGSIKAPQVIEFLKHLQPHMGCQLMVIWDGLPVHRSRLVRSLSPRNGGKSKWSSCRPTGRNSIRSNTSGVTANSMSCPICAQRLRPMGGPPAKLGPDAPPSAAGGVVLEASRAVLSHNLTILCGSQ